MLSAVLSILLRFLAQLFECQGLKTVSSWCFIPQILKTNNQKPRGRKNSREGKKKKAPNYPVLSWSLSKFCMLSRVFLSRLQRCFQQSRSFPQKFSDLLLSYLQSIAQCCSHALIQYVNEYTFSLKTIVSIIHTSAPEILHQECQGTLHIDLTSFPQGMQEIQPNNLKCLWSLTTVTLFTCILYRWVCSNDSSQVQLKLYRFYSNFTSTIVP